MNSEARIVDSHRQHQLKQNELHLWCVDDTKIEDPELLEHYSSWLASEERSRWQRFYFARHRHQFLMTRALVRFGLSHYAPSIAPVEWRFGSNDYGRPAIDNRRMSESLLQFNVSHTQELIVVAFCLSGELGVDVEYHQKNCDAVLLAERFFSPCEALELRALPQAQQQHRFFDYWTLKEAYIKARGMGLAIPLDSFSFELSASSKIGFNVEPEAKDSADGWQFWQVRPNVSHQIAVAYRGDETPADLTLRYFRVVPGVSIEPQEFAMFRASV